MNKRTESYKYINIHHTAGNEANTAAVKREHLNMGWGDIGYNAVVERDGTIGAGRSIDYIGAHNVGMSPDKIHVMNEVSFGVSFIGNFEVDFMSEVQLTGGARYIAQRCIEFKLEPIKEIIRKHSEDYPTLCPGKNFPYDELLRRVSKFVEIAKAGSKVKKAVVYYSSGDVSVAEAVAARLGGVAMFCRNSSASVHPDAMAAEQLFVIGGPSLGHPNEVYMSGPNALETIGAVYEKYKGGAF